MHDGDDGDMLQGPTHLGPPRLGVLWFPADLGQFQAKTLEKLLPNVLRKKTFPNDIIQ